MVVCTGRARNSAGKITGYKLFDGTHGKVISADALKRAYRTWGSPICSNLQLTADNKLRVVKKGTPRENLFPRQTYMSSSNFYKALGWNPAKYKQDLGVVVKNGRDNYLPFSTFLRGCNADDSTQFIYSFIYDGSGTTTDVYASDPDVPTQAIVTAMVTWDQDVCLEAHCRGLVFNKEHFNNAVYEYVLEHTESKSFLVEFFNGKEFNCSANELLDRKDNLFDYLLAKSRQC